MQSKVDRVKQTQYLFFSFFFYFTLLVSNASLNHLRIQNILQSANSGLEEWKMEGIQLVSSSLQVLQLWKKFVLKDPDHILLP